MTAARHPRHGCSVLTLQPCRLEPCAAADGNAEPDGLDHGKGTMEALYWGNGRNGAFHPGNLGDAPRGVAVGPWVMADIENGVWSGRNATENVRNTPIHAEFVTAMLKGDSGNHWALKGGDAQTGRLATLYDGARPEGYHPMKKQGAIVLGIGGDNSDFGVGTFYEGAMVSHYTSEEADAAVQANIVAAGYGR